VSDVNTVIVVYSKRRKMKNPCNECLVSAACTQICDAKINYGTLVNVAAERYRQYMRNPNERFIQKTKAILGYYTHKSKQHHEDLHKITKRERGLL
jgi:L-lactate utilization protein LutB